MNSMSSEGHFPCFLRASFAFLRRALGFAFFMCFPFDRAPFVTAILSENAAYVTDPVSRDDGVESKAPTVGQARLPSLIANAP